MYKVGELVRALSNGGYGEYITAGNVYEVAKVYSGGAVDILSEGEVLHMFSEEIEPVTHLTTKEFIKLVEGMGYKVDDIKPNQLTVRNATDGIEVMVHTSHLNKIDTFWSRPISEEVFKVSILYANTPLELREEKKETILERMAEIISTGNIHEQVFEEYFVDTPVGDMTKEEIVAYAIKELTEVEEK